MIGPDLASKLLDDIIYQRVLGCIDLEELTQLEHDLWFSVFELGPSQENSWTLAREMLDRAFARLHRELPRLSQGAPCPCDEQATRERREPAA